MTNEANSARRGNPPLTPPGRGTGALDRLPPHSTEAEQGVLGCILWAPNEAMTECVDRLTGMDPWAYDLRHQKIFEAMRALHGDLKPIELITLQQKLKDWDFLDQVGGIAYLSALQDSVPSAANLPHYLDIIRDKWRRRTAITAATQLTARLYDSEDSAAALDEALTHLERVVTQEDTTRETHIKKILPTVITNLEKYHRGRAQLHGLPTGLEYLDKVIQGIDKTHYMVIAGRPGDGKTTLAMNIVEHLTLDHEWWQETDEAGAAAASAAGQRTAKHDDGKFHIQRRGIPVAVFSLEMDKESLVTRMVFGRGGADMGRWNTGMASADDFKALTIGVNQLNQANVWIDDLSDQTIGKIRSRARRMVKEHGIQLFVLDYIQLLDVDDEKLRNDRVRELTKISKAIVSLKKQLKVPWLVLAQMNRNIEQADAKRVPVLSDLKDCGALEQDADVVLFLYRPPLKDREEHEQILDEHFGDDWTKKPALVNGYVAKNRYGPTGKAEMLFWKNMTKFEDLRKWLVTQGKTGPAKGESYRRVEPEELPTDEELRGKS